MNAIEPSGFCPLLKSWGGRKAHPTYMGAPRSMLRFLKSKSLPLAAAWLIASGIIWTIQSSSTVPAFAAIRVAMVDPVFLDADFLYVLRIVADIMSEVKIARAIMNSLWQKLRDFFSKNPPTV